MKNLKLKLCVIPLNRKIRKFCQIVTNDDCVPFMGTDFGYYPYDDNRIEYAIFISDRAGQCFYNDMGMRAKEKNVELEDFDIFLCCLLHEIGHYFTRDENISDQCQILRNILNEKSLSAVTWEEREKIFYDYHMMEDEKMATDWAHKNDEYDASVGVAVALYKHFGLRLPEGI